MKSVALLTDFGLKDPFVGMMKAVIVARSGAEVQFLDLTHEVPAQNIRTGAFFLRAAEAYLPDQAAVVAVVDPGVGSARHILLARTKRNTFLAPDNGLLSWLKEPFVELRQVTNPKFALPGASATFHGRDIFAPVCAALLSGTAPSELGPEVKEMVRLPALRLEKSDDALVGEIVAVDHFGNCWTSIETGKLPKDADIVFRGKNLGPVRGHYAEVEPQKSLAVAGSFGVVELCVRNGDFSRTFEANVGDEVVCRG